MFSYIKGNLLESNVNVIVHQINLKGVMGAGLAKQIKYKYPKVYEDYISNYSTMKLGDVLFTQVNKHKFVLGIAGQQDIGTYKQQTDYSALEKGLNIVKNFCEKRMYTIGLPYGVGCGLGGGDWEVVLQLVNEIFKGYFVSIYVL